MASIRAHAGLRHSVSRHGYVGTFRTVTKDDSETSCDHSHVTGLEQQDRNFWLTHDSNKIVFVYRITL